jgi:hypothetical protein
MTAADLLARLDAVVERGPGRWIALCPAHEDRTPSLSVRDADGVTLLHCWAGCEAHEITAAVGLAMSDLFPPRAPHVHHAAPRRRPMIAPGDALALLRREVLIVAIAARELAEGRALAAGDHARVLSAAGRIATVAGGVS